MQLTPSPPNVPKLRQKILKFSLIHKIDNNNNFNNNNNNNNNNKVNFYIIKIFEIEGLQKSYRKPYHNFWLNFASSKMESSKFQCWQIRCVIYH